MDDIVAGRISRAEFIKRAAVLGLGMPTIGTLLAACGQSSDTSSPSAASGAGKDRIVTAWSATPERLNQQTTFSPAATDAIINLNEPLVRWKLHEAEDVKNGWEIPWKDTAPDFEKVMEGRLMESWDVDDKYLVHTFHLRKGMPSHAGNEFTSEDVRYTFQDLDFGFKAIGYFFHQAGSQLDPKKIKVLDKYTVQVTLDEPNPLWLMGLNQMYRQIVDSKVVKAHTSKDDPYGAKWMDTHDVGFGPYTLATYQVGTEWSYEAFKDYKLDPKPPIKNVVQRAIPDGAQRVALLQKGDIDVAFQLQPQQLKALEQTPGVAVDRFKGVLILSLNLNPSQKPLDNPTVRQALAYAVPYEQIVKNVFLGYGRTATLCPDVFAGSVPSPYTYDIEKAKSLLAQAGHPNGFEMEVVYDSADTLAEPIGILLQTGFSRIGVKTHLKALPTAAYYEGLNKHNLPAGIYRNAPHTPDPHWCTSLNYLSDSANNWFAYDNPKVDKAIHAASHITDYAKRLATYGVIEKTILDDAPMIPIVMPGFQVAKRDNIAGLTEYTEQVLWAYVNTNGKA